MMDSSRPEEMLVQDNLKPTSKTLILTAFGGYDKVKLVERPRPRPGKGEVVIEVKATGVNFSELMARMGNYNVNPTLPCVLGSEGAGVVVDLGDGVTRHKLGDRVICFRERGLWSEYATAGEWQCFPLPEHMSFEEGAALPINYLTAYLVLFEFGHLRPGHKVLVHMAAGGVGIAATQLCKTVPDVTVFGTASPQKHKIIEACGVTHPIDYRNKDYVKEVRRISPEGVDIVMDPLAAEDTARGYSLLKPMGKIITFGAANMVKGTQRSLWTVLRTFMKTMKVSPIDMMEHNKGVCGFHLGHMSEAPALIASSMESLIRMYYEGKIKPKIDSVWSFEEVAGAMAQMQERRNIGKVILVPEKSQVSKGSHHLGSPKYIN